MPLDPRLDDANYLVYTLAPLEQLPPADPQRRVKPSEYPITQDSGEETTTVRLHVETGGADNRLELKSAFTVSDPLPVDATFKAENPYRVRRARRRNTFRRINSQRR